MTRFTIRGRANPEVARQGCDIVARCADHIWVEGEWGRGA